MKFYFLSFLAFLSLFASAQELGKVTLEELKATHSKIDSTAVAETIFAKGVTSFFVNEDQGYFALTEMIYKIKIFKKEGFDYANIAIPYYKEGSSFEKVSISDAATYNLVGDKIVKTKLKSSEEFIVNESENWKTKKFVFPNVKEGSVIEYKVKLTTPFIWNLNTWNFQTSIPVLYSYYKISAPDKLVYQHFSRGYEPINVVKNPDFYEYSIANVKPLKDESFVNNVNNYRSSLRLELASFIQSNGMPKNFSNTWESLIAEIYKGDFGTELNRTRYFGSDLENLMKGVENREDKINTIFNYVQSKFTWNGKNGYNTELGVREAYKSKTGNVADINLVLIAMLREAGIEVSPILLSTRNHGVAYTPSHSAYNYVIAGIEVPNALILLDATSKYSRPNILPIRALNWTGRIIRKSGSSAEVDLIPSLYSNLNAMYTINLNEDGSISGNARTKRNNYNAHIYRANYADLSKDALVKQIQDKYTNFEINDFEHKNFANLDQDILETYDFKVNQAADIIGDQIFFEPSFVFNIKNNPFLDEDRKYPVDFVYNQKETISYIITIPDGYEVEYLPKSSLLKLQSDRYIIKWVISADKNKISLRINEEINQPIISAEEYKELKLLFDEYVKLQTEKIILKKI